MNREQMIVALREAADWLAAHPELPEWDFYSLSVNLPTATSGAELRFLAATLGSYKPEYSGNYVFVRKTMPAGGQLIAGMIRVFANDTNWADAILNGKDVMDKVVDGVLAESNGGGA